MRFSLLGFCLLSAVIPLFSACAEDAAPARSVVSSQPRPAKIITLKSDEGRLTHRFPGTIQASRVSELAFRVGGELVALPARAGMVVRKGEVLAQLDDRDFRNTLTEREAKYDLALTQHQRAKTLFEKNYTTKAGLDEAAANLKAAKAALEIARDELGYTRLRAPFGGLIGSVSVENHQAITARAGVMQLQDDAETDVVFNVPESLMTKVHRIEDPRGLCGTVRFNARPELSYRACYKEHDSVPDPLTRTYRVVYSMPRIEAFPALPGMAVSIEQDLTGLLSPTGETGVVVPVEAVFDEAGTQWVWRVNEQMAVERVAVTCGSIQGAGLRLLHGVDPGDRVVVAGVSRLREGQRVVPFVKERGL